MKKKILTIISALVLIVCLSTALVACGDNDSDKDSLPADYDNYFLTDYVDYSSLRFNQITSEDATEAISSWTLSEIESAGQLNLEGTFTYNDGEDDSVDSTHTFSCLISADETLYVKAEIDDATVIVERKNEHVYFAYKTAEVEKKYNVDVTEFMSDFFYNVYGLTKEEVMQKQTAYNESLEDTEEDNSDTEESVDNSTMMLLVNTFVSYLMDNDAICVSTATDNGYTHVKIQAMPSFIDTLTTMIASFLSNMGVEADLVQQVFDVLIKDLDTFDLCLTFYKNVVVGVHIDVDITLPIMFEGVISKASQMIETTPLFPWLDTEPVAYPSKVVETLGQFEDVFTGHENAWVKICASFDFKNVKEARVGSLNDKNTTKTSFVELLGEPTAIEQSTT